METTNNPVDSMMSFSDFLSQKYGDKAPKVTPDKTSTRNLSKLLPPEKRANAEIANEITQASQADLPFGQSDQMEVVSKAVQNIQNIVDSLVRYNEKKDREEVEKERLSKSWGELKPVDLVNIKKFTQNVELSKKSLDEIKKLIEQSTGGSSDNQDIIDKLMSMLPGAGAVGSVIPKVLQQVPKAAAAVAPTTAARAGALARFLPSPATIVGGVAATAIISNTDRIREYRKDLEAKGEAQHEVKDVEKLAQPNATVGKTTTSIDRLALNPATKKYKDLFITAGEKYGIDPNLLAAQVYQESRGNPNAVSPKGAKGLSQFTPATAKQYGVDVKDPKSSIDGQARYMRDLLEQFNGDVSKALAAYNAGPGNVRKAEKLYGSEWLENLQYVTGIKNASETLNYVNTIQGKSSSSYTYKPVKTAVAKPAALTNSTESVRKSGTDAPVKPFDYRGSIDRMVNESAQQKEKAQQPVIITTPPAQQSAPSNVIQTEEPKGNLTTRNPNSNLQTAQLNELRRIR